MSHCPKRFWVWNLQSHKEDLKPDDKAGRDDMICKYEIDAYWSNKVYIAIKMCQSPVGFGFIPSQTFISISFCSASGFIYRKWCILNLDGSG